MDDADISEERVRVAMEADLARLREAAAKIPAGKPGECDMCGEWSARLVDGACAPCRDKYGLK